MTNFSVTKAAATLLNLLSSGGEALPFPRKAPRMRSDIQRNMVFTQQINRMLFHYTSFLMPSLYRLSPGIEPWKRLFIVCTCNKLCAKLRYSVELEGRIHTLPQKGAKDITRNTKKDVIHAAELENVVSFRIFPDSVTASIVTRNRTKDMFNHTMVRKINCVREADILKNQKE